MKKILILSFFTSINILCAQTTFQKTYGGNNTDIAKCVKQTSDGGYFLIGSTYTSGAGNGDIYAIRTDQNGDTLWRKKYGSGDTDLGYSGQQTTDGGYIFCGTTSGFSAPGSKMYLLKTDLNGNLLWSKVFLNGNAFSVLQTNDSGYIMTGTANGQLAIVRTDFTGDTLWTKLIGGAGNDIGSCISKTLDNGFIIVGYTNSFGLGNYDMFLVKIDANGNTLFTKTYGGTNDDRASAVQQTIDSGYILSGLTNSYGAGQSDIFLLKADSIGNVVWSKTMGGINNDEANSVQQTTDGGFAIAGFANYSISSSSCHMVLIKCDSTGSLVWHHAYGKSSYNDWGYAAQQTTDGGYIVTGTTYSFSGFGGQYDDIYLVKTNSTGSSGCFEPVYSLSVTDTLCQTTNPAISIASGLTALIHTTLINSGGLDSALCIVVGINETFTKQDLIIVSPNPVFDVLSINGTNEKGEVWLYSIDGKTIIHEFTSDNKTELKIDALPVGLYVLKYKMASRIQYIKLTKM